MPNYKAAFEAASADLSAIMSLLGFTSYPGIDPMLRAITNLILAKAEAQSLREEVAEYEALCNRQAELLSQSIIAIRGPEPELTRWGYSDLPLRVKTVVEEVAVLRARAVVPGRITSQGVPYAPGWNACLDELERLNGKAVSEGDLEALRKDKARLDRLDQLNAALNAKYGTTYRWQVVVNHNVNRLMLGHLVIDLNDQDCHGQPSCRDALDTIMPRPQLEDWKEPGP